MEKSKELSDVIVKAIQDKKGEKITRLCLKGVDGAICDYFVICQVDNPRQVLAIADNVEDEVREQLEQKPLHVEGKDNAMWVLLDYMDVVVHIFDEQSRAFYNLEKLWADALREDFEDVDNLKTV